MPKLLIAVRTVVQQTPHGDTVDSDNYIIAIGNDIAQIKQQLSARFKCDIVGETPDEVVDHICNGDYYGGISYKSRAPFIFDPPDRPRYLFRIDQYDVDTETYVVNFHIGSQWEGEDTDEWVCSSNIFICNESDLIEKLKLNDVFEFACNCKADEGRDAFDAELALARVESNPRSVIELLKKYGDHQNLSFIEIYDIRDMSKQVIGNVYYLHYFGIESDTF